MTKMLKCLACGSRISETGLLRLVENDETGLLSKEEIQQELQRDQGMVACPSCSEEGSWLVPQDAWEAERYEVEKLRADSLLELAKAYDRNSVKADDRKVSEVFASRAERLRQEAREAKEKLDG